MSWIWSVAPIPLILLLGTWLGAPDWLLERDILRAWLRPALALILPAAALLTAVLLYRIYQIPAVDPVFSPEEFARPVTAEERATFEMYRRAWLMLVLGNHRKAPQVPPASALRRRWRRNELPGKRHGSRLRSADRPS